MSSLLSLPSSSSQIGNTGGRGGVAGTNQYPPPSSLLYCFPDDHKPNQTASPHQVKNVIHTSASNTTYRPRAAWRPSGSPSRSLSATNSINLSMPTSPRSSQLRGIPSSSSIPSYQRSTAASSAAKAPTASISRTPRRHAASRVAMTEKRLMKVRDSVDSAAAEVRYVTSSSTNGCRKENIDDAAFLSTLHDSISFPSICVILSPSLSLSLSFRYALFVVESINTIKKTNLVLFFFLSHDVDS